MTEQQPETQKACWIDNSNCYHPEKPTLDQCKLCQEARNKKFASYSLGQTILEFLKQVFPMQLKKPKDDEP